MKMKRLSLNIAATILSLGVFAAPALADSYGEMLHTALPSTNTEVWVDTTVPNGLGTFSGYDATYHQLVTKDAYGNEMSTIGLRELSPSGSYSKIYVARLAYYQGGTNYYNWVSVSSPTAASAGTGLRFYTRVYPDSGSPTGYKIDATVNDGTDHSTGYYYLSSAVGVNFRQARVGSTYENCNKGNYTRSYYNAWVKPGSSFAQWSGTDTPQMASSCGVNASSYGTLISGGTTNVLTW